MPPSRPARRIAFVGPDGAGIRTLVGRLIYMCNGLDLESLSYFEKKGQRKYDAILGGLRELGKTPSFETQKHDITIAEDSGSRDCTLLVISFDASVDDPALRIDQYKSPIVCVMNKADVIEWNSQKVAQMAEKISIRLKSQDVDLSKIPVVLVDALRGENIVVPTEKDCGIVLGDKIQTGLHQQLSLMQCLDNILIDYAKQDIDK